MSRDKTSRDFVTSLLEPNNFTVIHHLPAELGDSFTFTHHIRFGGLIFIINKMTVIPQALVGSLIPWILDKRR